MLDRICSQTWFLRSEDKALCYLLIKTTFWSHIQDSLSSYLVPPLSFSSFSTEDSILQQGSSPSLKPSAASTPCYSSGNHARICFISFFTYSSTPIHLPLPSSADTFWNRYWCLDWCPSVLVLLSKLTSSSTVLSAIPALECTKPTPQALMRLIRFPLFDFDLHSFLTRLTNFAVLLPFCLSIESLVKL